MAKKGLSKPFLGEYDDTNGNLTYTNGRVLGHAIEYGVEIEESDDNPLYGDNVVIEHDNGAFSGGTLTLNTSELTQADSKWLLGVTEQSVSVGSKTVKELVFNDDLRPKVLGFGIIEQHQINDIDMYRTVVLCKVVPNIPPEAATTRGESIEWQTEEITFRIERAGDAKHSWKRTAEHESEADAAAYLSEVLGVGQG